MNEITVKLKCSIEEIEENFIDKSIKKSIKITIKKKQVAQNGDIINQEKK